MTTKALRLHRRAVLKGLGGITLGLPLLECMIDGNRAFAATGVPKRYVVFAHGQSMGADNDPRPNLYAPNTVGPNYDLKVGTQYLSGFANGGAAIKEEITIISGLRIPVGGPGGRFGGEWHVSSPPPLLAGIKSTNADINQNWLGASSDQIIKDTLNAGASLRYDSLAFQCQPIQYSVGGNWGVMSYKKNANGSIQRIVPQTSPRAAWQSLFGGFTGGASVDPAVAAAAASELELRKSVLDVVRTSANSLLGRVGSADKQRLQEHFDQVRDLEARVNAISPENATALCKAINDPGADPSVGGDYSDEEKRSRIFIDLMTMALICDMTRVGTLMLTNWQTRMSGRVVASVNCDIHNIGHNELRGGGNNGTNQTENMAKAQAWATKQWASFVANLRDTADGAGGKLLDHTVTTLMFEGGHGPGDGKQHASHSSDNMICAVAGRAGGMKRGVHLKVNNEHPAKVLISMMKAVGYTSDTLNEVTGELPGLRG